MEIAQQGLQLQTAALDEQRRAVQEELTLQRDALRLQTEALQTEMVAQRRAAIGGAYARFLGSLEAYRAEIRKYVSWIEKNYTSDKNQRATMRAPIARTFEEIRRAGWEAAFVDPDREREAMREKLSQGHLLEPQAGDTPATQKHHAAKVREDLELDRATANQLRDHLVQELGLRPTAAVLVQSEEAADPPPSPA